MTTSLNFRFTDSSSMRDTADSSVSLVVTSPPYPMIAMWDESFSSRSADVAQALGRNDGNAAFEAMHGLLDAVWKECFRVLMPGGFLCVNIGDAVRTVGTDFRLYSNHARVLSACSAIGFTALPLVLWRKQTNAPNKFMGSGMLPAGAYVTLEHEYILVLRKGGKRVFATPEDKLSRKRSAYFWEERNVWFSDVWDFKGARQDLAGSGTRDRSAAFPFELAFRLVNMYSVRGDTVLDPFTGTGTTGLACLASERNFIGCELDGNFFPRILSGIRDFSAVVNGFIDRRLDSHARFMERYEAEGKTPKHMNRIHGFPVVTSQEAELELRFVDRISVDRGTVRIAYRDAPRNGKEPQSGRVGRPVPFIRRATEADLPSVMELIRSAVSRLRENGIDQWDEIYPSETVFRTDTEDGSLFLVEIPGAPAATPAACIVLNTKTSPEYGDVAWRDAAGRFLVVHRLCVSARLQGTGIGRAVMEFAEEFAESNGFSSIRLDAFVKNPRSLALYDSLGFERMGTVEFRKGTFMCFELDVRTRTGDRSAAPAGRGLP